MRDEEATDLTMVIVGLGGVVVFGNVSDLKRVSVERGGVVEKQSDLPKESAGAHETCRDLLGHVLFPLQTECICLAHGEVVGSAVSYS